MIRTFLFTASIVAASAASAEVPQISDLHIELPPPGAPVAAGYMKLINVADEALVITGASSDAAKRVELHLSIIENDVARMERQDDLVVEPGATLVLEHGSYHLMFMGLLTPFKEGDAVSMTLDTNMGPIDLSMPIARGGSTGDQGSHGAHTDKPMKHDGMKMDDDMSEKMPMEGTGDAMPSDQDHK